MMASIGSILSVARTALPAHQAAIGVLSHNLPNATTEGYSRQGAGSTAAGLRDRREVRAAEDAAATHGALASQADIIRSSVSGVSTDGELVQLIRFENAYSAAPRVVPAADEMLQTILDMKR